MNWFNGGNWGDVAALLLIIVNQMIVGYASLMYFWFAFLRQPCKNIGRLCLILHG